MPANSLKSPELKERINFIQNNLHSVVVEKLSNENEQR